MLKGSRALLLVFEHGSKIQYSDENASCISQATAYKDVLIDKLVEIVRVLHEDEAVAKKQTIPPFVTVLVYKAAAITTERIHTGINLEVNLRRLRILRSTLVVLAQRWLAGGERA